MGRPHLWLPSAFRVRHRQESPIGELHCATVACRLSSATGVNFITGQNGSGKSAILTALCIAFGCRAKGTQRASTLKDFIKTDCSYAVVHVELKNQGEDAFKPEIYGDVIVIERRISGTATTTVLKDQQGKKVASRKEDLRELVEHFNVSVHPSTSWSPLHQLLMLRIHV
ncbi:unnamed protein product [Prunus armeniaca]